MYFMKNVDGKESNTAKGVNIATEFNDLKTFYLIKISHEMKNIQSKKHKLGTYEINKISSLCFDDERFVLNDRIHTLAYFHKDIDSKDSHNKKRSTQIKKILITRGDAHG